jgi:formate-dependent nitrite reductase membrane component NrfD
MPWWAWLIIGVVAWLGLLITMLLVVAVRASRAVKRELNSANDELRLGPSRRARTGPVVRP